MHIMETSCYVHEILINSPRYLQEQTECHHERWHKAYMYIRNSTQEFCNEELRANTNHNQPTTAGLVCETAKAPDRISTSH